MTWYTFYRKCEPDDLLHYWFDYHQMIRRHKDLPKCVVQSMQKKMKMIEKLMPNKPAIK